MNREPGAVLLLFVAYLLNQIGERFEIGDRLDAFDHRF